MNFAILNCACLILTLYSMLKPLELFKTTVRLRTSHQISILSCSSAAPAAPAKLIKPHLVNSSSDASHIRLWPRHWSSFLAFWAWHSAWWSWRLVSQDGYSSTFSTMFLLDTFGFISSFLLQIVRRYYGLLASKFDCFWQGARTRRRRGRGATVGPCSTWLGSERTWFDVGMIWWIYGDYCDLDFCYPLHQYHRRSPCDARSLNFSSQSCGNTDCHPMAAAICSYRSCKKIPMY